MKKYLNVVAALFLFGMVLFTACQPEKITKGSQEHIATITSAIDDDMLANADGYKGDWLSYGRNYSETRYSELTQINKENIGQLGLAWAAELGTTKGIQATPIVVDGILFFSGPKNVVYAFDTRTGKEIWKFDAELNPDRFSDLCCGFVNRGLAIYKGDLFMGTLDGRLVSINAATGTKNWEVLTIPEDGKHSITGAPRIANGKVIIGNGGAELGARGFVSAYDAATGKQVWRFYTVPGDPNKPFEHPDLKEAAKTWSGNVWWKQGGGGTVWDAIVYDPELNLVYIGVGNGAHWNREFRSPGGGDNLYLSSIVALNADDGSYVWHFQTTPGETWDYTATQPIILADLEIEGKMRKVLMQAPKNGYFYVIDRTNGQFISANNYAYQNWTTGIDKNGRPIEAEGARYTDGKTHWIAPSMMGGHNWYPMSYNPKTGLVYIPTNKQSAPYAQSKGSSDTDVPGGGRGFNMSLSTKLYKPTVYDNNPNAPIPWVNATRLIAWDPIAQKEVWGLDRPIFNSGGLLSTAAGLLLQGDAAGMFTIRDVKDGKELWNFDIRSGAIAPPITYLVDGEQYLTILVGWGGASGITAKYVDRIHPGTIYTFKIGGKATPPKKLPTNENPLTSLRTKASPEQIGNGWNVWTQYCITCHPALGTGDAANPDIARSSNEIFDNFDEIVREGIFLARGMPGFKDAMTKEELNDLKDYIFYSAQALEEGMSPTDYMTNIAQMQYLADQKKVLKD